MVFLKLKILQKIKLKHTKNVKKELGNERNITFVYICSDLMSRIIKKILEVKKEEAKKKRNKKMILGVN